MNTTNDPANEVREQRENYETTLLALQAFVSATTWDADTKQRLPGSEYSFGRRMDTTPHNRVTPSTTVTPDLVIQPNTSLGLVAEAKGSLTINSEYWNDVIRQLEKYDDDLIGWWTPEEKMDRSCIVLLIIQSRGARFRKYIEELQKEKGQRFYKPFSLIEFNRATQVNEYLFLRKNSGQIEDRALAEALEDGIMVPIEKMVATCRSVKFYDAEPVTEHTMVVLWQDVFNEMKRKATYDESRNAWLLDVNASALTKDLQSLFGSVGNKHREVEFPKVQWIRKALDAFVKIGLAKKQNDNGGYLILFKPIKADLIEKFVGHRKKAQELVQLPLIQT